MLVCITLNSLMAQSTMNCNCQDAEAILPTAYSWDPSSTMPSGWYSYGMGLYTTGNLAPNSGKFDSKNDSLIIHYNQTANYIKTYLKGNSLKPPYVFSILESENGCTYTPLQIFTDTTENITSKFTAYTWYPQASSRYIKLTYSLRTSGNIAIDDLQIQADATTEIIEHEIPFNVYIYPNPTHDILYIQSFNDSFEAVIFDVLGNKITSRILGNSDTAEINTTTFKSGIYFVSIINEGEVIKTRRFIKR